jgi:hypothetical protein
MTIITALPFTLTNGQVADATQVMADFNQIVTQVNTNALALAGGVMTGPFSLSADAVSALQATTLQQMTAAIAAAVAAATGLVKISSGTTAAGSTLQWITLSGGYSKYRLVLENFVPASASGCVALKGSTDNRSTTVASNEWAGSFTNTGGGPAGTHGTGVAYVQIGADAHTGASRGSEYIVDITQSRATSEAFVSVNSSYWNSGVAFEHFVGGGVIATTTALTDIQILTTTGNIGVSSQNATWTLYGYI